MPPAAGEAQADLALRVVELARADAISAAGFLAPAIGRLAMAPMGLECAIATNGRMLAVDPQRVLAAFAANGNPPAHDVLHAALHCVLLHPFSPGGDDESRWWLACDVVVEALAARILGLRGGERGARTAQALHDIETATGDASNVNRVLNLLKGQDDSQVNGWMELFAADDHAFWGRSGAFGRAVDVQQEPGDAIGTASPPRDAYAAGASVGRDVGEQDDLREAWERIARDLKATLENTPRDPGSRAGVLVQAVDAALRERVDYASWLRRFAVPGEVMKLSDDGFDLVFYTYGLRRYGNLPLVEPLEQREERRIREFVIVIDTSQSVSGEAVRRFVDETYGILKEGESFFERVQVRIIQCDARVQSDTVITDLRELEQWVRDVRLRGFGGTDFRPAFRYVDHLVEEGAFEHLGGLVYFTDGWGVYPEWRPRYPVAFAFYDEDHRAEDVPPWAVQVVLGGEDLPV